MAGLLVPILMGPTFGLSLFAAEMVSFAISMVASSIISKTFASDPPKPNANENSLNTGANLQVAPATNNKLPIVYGRTFIGGTITDLSITTDNQDLYYVMSICEVTGGSSPDTITFGNIYYGGKLCVFDGTDQTKVVGLTDQSTNTTDNTVSGHLYIYLYNNGSSSPVNSSTSAITVMQSTGLTYTWDSTKLMSNSAFAIVHLNYNQNANITNIEQTQFEIINSRNSAGDVIYDYLTNTRYGAAIPVAQIDTASLTALNTYCNQVITYTPYSGGSATQARFKMNGFVDTTKTVMQNLQDMTNSCDCLLKYNEIYGKWSVIVQSPTYTVAININDSNMISSMNISTLDISNTYNIAQCQFPDLSINSAFNTTQIDLAVVAPLLLYPNEPVNMQTIQLNLCNNNVQAQMLGNRFLKAARMDLQVTCTVGYIGLELEAGDIVTITSVNYGWTAKLFRITKVIQKFGESGEITVDLTMTNYDPTVFNDANITQFTPSANTGLPNPNIFGTIPTPTVSNTLVSAPVPSFQVNVTTSTAGITQYAEVWYSAFSSPSMSQMIFAGTTAVQSNGTPYGNSVAMPAVTITGLTAGNWYFFSRMVNSVAKSAFSSASAVFNWRPLTFQFSERYLSIAYATSATGTGFSSSPRSGKTYFGLSNSNVSSFDPTPINYTWYLANPTFGTTNYLLFSNRSNNLVSFATGGANYASGTAQFVPSDANYDPTIWNGLQDGYNIIDLNLRTGQLIQAGTTTVGTGEIAITNNPQGQVVASLAQLLTFAGGAYTKTASAATLTIDIYGRVVGFAAPDSFYYTMTAFTASSGQTVFSLTRGAQYVTGNCWVFKNGLLLDTTEYTDGASSVTLATGAVVNDIMTFVSFASVNSSSVTYNSFTRNTVTLSNQATYTASGFTLVSGTELLFLNGTVVNAQDYDIAGQDITFISAATGNLQVIQWTLNNLSVPNGTPVNVDAYTTVGQATYPFTFDPNAFNLWNNGALLLETVDYSVTTGYYTLAQTPLVNTNILVQQTFSRTGAV
jgi:YHS domain-containing protein